jgi:hypothetical protein
MEEGDYCTKIFHMLQLRKHQQLRGKKANVGEKLLQVNESGGSEDRQLRILSSGYLEDSAQGCGNISAAVVLSHGIFHT